MANYFLNILIAFDRMINAFLNGDPDETLSSVAYRKNRDKTGYKWTMPFINWLFHNENHCLNAYNDDRSRHLKP